MRVKIIAFGQLAEITGQEFYVEAADTAVLKTALQIEFPALEKKEYTIAVNNRLIKGTYVLKENDEVALMPPYSGG